MWPCDISTSLSHHYTTLHCIQCMLSACVLEFAVLDPVSQILSVRRSRGDPTAFFVRSPCLQSTSSFSMCGKPANRFPCATSLLGGVGAAVPKPCRCLVQFLDPNQLLMEIDAGTAVKGIVDVFEEPDMFGSDQQQHVHTKTQP